MKVLPRHFVCIPRRVYRNPLSSMVMLTKECGVTVILLSV